MSFLDKFFGGVAPPDAGASGNDGEGKEKQGSDRPFVGSNVLVKRRSGETESDWLLLGYDNQTGEAMAAKYDPQGKDDFLWKGISQKDFLKLNQDQITQPEKKGFPAIGDEVQREDPHTRQIEREWLLMGFDEKTGAAVLARYDQKEKKCERRRMARDRFFEINKPPEKEGFKTEIGAESYGHHQPNEDDLSYSRENGFAAVCDGVSTAQGSAVASRIVAEAMKGYLANISQETSANGMRQYVHNAMVRTIGELSATATGHPEAEKMATTLSMVKFAEKGKKIIIGQVGDSRVCLLRQGKLHRLSPEDSHSGILLKLGIIESDEDVNQEIDLDKLRALWDANKDNREMGYDIFKVLSWAARVKEIAGKVTLNDVRAVITQIMSPKGHIEPHILVYDVMPGDEFVLTTDGVHDNLIDAEMAEAIIGEKSAEGKARKLVSKARLRMNDKNHPRAKDDDATAIVIKA